MELTIWASFGAGVLTFFSPCVLPLVPVYMSFVTGFSVEELKSIRDVKSLTGIVINLVFFISGFTLLFVALGASASVIGSFLFNYRQLFIRVAGAIIIIFGLHLLEIIQIPFLTTTKRIDIQLTQVSKTFFAFVMGITFGLGWSPCSGPILGSILLLASTSSSVLKGVYYLLAYSLGLAIPLFFVGLAFSSFIRFYSKRMPLLGMVNKLAGAFLLFFGILMATGRLSILYSIFGV